MKDALKKLTKEQLKFICSECNVTEDELFAMSEDSLYDDVYDIMCDIEIEKIPAEDEEEESERCVLASDIVTVLGNALASEEGFFDAQDEEVEKSLNDEDN